MYVGMCVCVYWQRLCPAQGELQNVLDVEYE